MNKHERQNALLGLISERQITSQAELVARLQDAGYTVTQASVSRDLDELGITKAGGVYSLPRRGLAELGDVRFETAGCCLLVGRCMPGLASAVTVRIDRTNVEGIVGTIAGDDTIFIAVKDGARDSVMHELKDLFG